MLVCVQEVIQGEEISLECSVQCFPYPSFHYFELEKKDAFLLYCQKNKSPVPHAGSFFWFLHLEMVM